MNLCGQRTTATGMKTEVSQDDERVCYSCVGDCVLADEVKEQGTRNKCSYCGRVQEALKLSALVERIHNTLQEHFELTPHSPGYYESMLDREGIVYWERQGELVEHVIADIAGLHRDLARDIVKWLSDSWYTYRAVKGGGEHPYDSDSFYEERDPEVRGFRETWKAFKCGVRTRARFFDPFTEDFLNTIFEDLADHKVHGDSSVVRVIGPDDVDRFVWRGRTAQSSQLLETILKSPARELGPPPSEVATAGRMNSQGISVFYGAMEQSTCVAELRPPVGSYVVIGKFELLHAVRLLDLGALAEVYVTTSYFDPEYSKKKGRVAFLWHLVHEISQPIVPEEAALEYIPTQVVAEYLAHKIPSPFDGIIYPSSQINGGGNNVVLFNHARRVETYCLPSEASVDVKRKSFFDSEEDEHEEIWVSEVVPSNPTEEVPTSGSEITRSGPIRFFPEDDLVGAENSEAPTLRLDVESVEVLEVKGVTYSTSSLSVKRTRRTEEELKSLKRDIADLPF